MRRHFPTLALTATLTAVALLGAGCGDDDGGDATADDTASSQSTPAADATDSDTASSAATTQPSSGDLARTTKNLTLTEPAEGAEVSGSFKATGKSNSFEGTTPWEIRDADAKVVQKGFATAGGWGEKQYPWSTKVDVSSLDPGSYTFVVMTDDPSGGAEGSGPEEVGATIVVK